MASPVRKIENSHQLIAGILTRKEAALQVIKGGRHIHSHLSGKEDPTVSLTTRALKDHQIPKYAWELKDATQVQLKESSARAELIENLVASCVRSQKRELIEKVKMIAEELFTNALYHSCRRADGQDVRHRQSPVSLSDAEAVRVSFGSTLEGVYLSVEDTGGLLKFEDVTKALARSYGGPSQVIENKEGGAGLGIYMVFEAATHFKVQIVPEKMTRIACWIADPKLFSPTHFSFNFFDEAPQS